MFFKKEKMFFLDNAPALAFPCNAALIEHPQFYSTYPL